MRRLLGLMAAMVMIISIMGCSSSTSGSVASDGYSEANAKKVMLIRKKEGSGDPFIINHLKKLGYQVMDIVDSDFTVEKAKGYGVIYVSESVNSSKIDPKLKNSTIPVVYAKAQAASDAELVGVQKFGQDDGVKTVRIIDSKHPIASGLKDTVALYKEDGRVGYGLHPAKDASIIAQIPASGDNKKAAIFAYEKGAKNMSNTAVPARQVFFSMPSGEEIKLTDNGWKLFDAAIEWASLSGKK
ncbi:hypothetical protein [Paenibacillus radicis (ex Xue et al. 2023)]|uniref:Lipoprotein n=1 Tax=Paenibacillus radicis (ex Xue et al. 2023) TaxID=2972489 RepID=A0ABT1YDI2_9BACL|nr:hypothetical protein [Paenibacillus radicis (ex Xue et al. 2023)]MCR8631263.1 hypothetical protein [Paenibacillus radicis (ex Xue et al. 2023)]